MGEKRLSAAGHMSSAGAAGFVAMEDGGIWSPHHIFIDPNCHSRRGKTALKKKRNSDSDGLRRLKTSAVG